MNYSQTLKQYKFNINESYKSKLKTKMATLMFSLFFVNLRFSTNHEQIKNREIVKIRIQIFLGPIHLYL